MEAPTWKQITTTVGGRKIKGEYCVQGHLTKVRTGDREKATDLRNSDPEDLARDMLRELVEESEAQSASSFALASSMRLGAFLRRMHLAQPDEAWGHE